MGSSSKEHRWSRFEWHLEKLANVWSNIFFNWTKAESTYQKLKRLCRRFFKQKKTFFCWLKSTLDFLRKKFVNQNFFWIFDSNDQILQDGSGKCRGCFSTWKISIFDPNLTRFFTKFLILYQILDFLPNFRFFYHNFDFLPNFRFFLPRFRFLTIISIFYQSFDFFTKISIFDQKFLKKRFINKNYFSTLPSPWLASHVLKHWRQTDWIFPFRLLCAWPNSGRHCSLVIGVPSKFCDFISLQAVASLHPVHSCCKFWFEYRTSTKQQSLSPSFKKGVEILKKKHFLKFLSKFENVRKNSINILIFDQNFDLWSNSGFDQNFDFGPKFRFSTKISIFDHKFWFSTINFDFRP